MGKQCLNECDSGIQKLARSQADYRARVTAAVGDGFMKERAAEWLADQAQRAAQETKDGAQLLLDGALRNQRAGNKVISSSLYQSI